MAFTKGRSGNPAGRPPGIIDRRHIEQLRPRVYRADELEDAFDGTPAQFFEAIYKDQGLPLETRMLAAATLIRAGLGGTVGNGLAILIQGNDAKL